MNDTFMNDHTACHSCDLLVQLPVLQAGEKAHCPRCGHLLSRRIHNGHGLSLAFAASALLFLVLSLQFPFLAFEAQGHVQQMTLLQSASALVALDFLPLALLLVLFILVLPALLLLLLVVVLVQLGLDEHSHWTKRFTHWLFAIEPWCMVEVFLIGVLVSLIKISAMADIVLGLSFWAYILFTLSMTAALSSLDKHYLWHQLAGGEEHG